MRINGHDPRTGLSHSEREEMRDLLYMIKDLMGMQMVMKLTSFDPPESMVIPSDNERWLVSRYLELRQKAHVSSIRKGMSE